MTDIKSKLYEPFDNIDSRRGRGGTYDYIKWQNVADRMNEVFGVNWSSNVIAQDTNGENLIVRVNVCVKDPVSGEHFCQEGYGGAVLRAGDEPGNAHKSAYSKALKDACKKWGVGLHIEEDSSSGGNVPTGYIGKETGVPPTSTPSVSTPPQTAQPAQVSPSMPQSAPTNQGVSTPPAQPPAQTPPMPPAQNTMPPVQQMPQAPPQVPAQEMGLPPTPAPSVDSGVNVSPAPPTQPAQQPETGAPDQNSPGTITNVQELAISNFINLSGGGLPVTDVLASLVNNPECELSRTVSDLKDLSFNEAVYVIKAMKSLQQ